MALPGTRNHHFPPMGKNCILSPIEREVREAAISGTHAKIQQEVGHALKIPEMLSILNTMRSLRSSMSITGISILHPTHIPDLGVCISLFQKSWINNGQHPGILTLR